METLPSRYQISLAFVAAAMMVSSIGCLAPGLVGNLAGGGERSGLSPSPVVHHLPVELPTPGYDLFRVVAWGMAIVLGALALAFVAKLLNGRGNSPSRSRPPFYDGPPEQRPPLA